MRGYVGCETTTVTWNTIDVPQSPDAPGLQADLIDVMRALPGCAAVKNAPVQPAISASLPFASGVRTRESEWMGAH